MRDGRLPLSEDHPLGLYHDDCRHLRGHELRLGGQPLRLLSASDAPGSGGSPQAWAAGALPITLIAVLGLLPDGLERKLRIRRRDAEVLLEIPPARVVGTQTQSLTVSPTSEESSSSRQVS
jgi:glycogen debranching enzyme